MWGKPETIQDHFERHGPDFGARSAEEYVQQSQDFYIRAQEEGLPTKIDSLGVVRVYDPETNTFGAYNMNGSTRTFFKPSWTRFTRGLYFDNLGGRLVSPDDEVEPEIPELCEPIEPIP
jgi:pyocin large subunit-like protein